MEIPIVPVIIKWRKPDGEVETVGVKNLFAVPVLLWQCDGDDCDTLAYEQRVATMINSHMHLLTLSPDREPDQVVYETFIKHAEHTLDAPGAAPDGPVTHVGHGKISMSMSGGANDQSELQGDAGSPQDQSDVPGSDNDSGEQVSGGDTPSDGEALHSGSGEPEQRS